MFYRHKKSPKSAIPAKLIYEDASSKHTCARWPGSPDPISPSHRSLRGAEKHTPAAEKTLWSLNNSLKNSHQADKTSYVISVYSRLCFYPACRRRGESSGNKYSVSLPCCLCFPQVLSFLFPSPHCFWHHSCARSALCNHEWKEEHDSRLAVPLTDHKHTHSSK